MTNNKKAAVQGFDLSAYSAAVLGCGGLGTNIAVHLAGAGIGRLLLYDFDTVETRNLNRQFFYTPADVGKEKCVLLAKRLHAYAPDCAVQSVSKAVRGADDLAEAAGVDILLIAADNIAARRAAQSFCKAHILPCVNGAIHGFFGTAYLYAPGKTPDLDAAGMLREPLSATLSPSTTAGVIGALQAKLAIDYLRGETSSAGVLLCYDGLEIQTLKIKE